MSQILVQCLKVVMLCLKFVIRIHCQMNLHLLINAYMKEKDKHKFCSAQPCSNGYGITFLLRCYHSMYKILVVSTCTLKTCR